MSYASPHAVDMHNVSKQYLAAAYPFRSRSERLSARGTGALNRGAQTTRVIDNLSLAIAEGEIFGVYGPQGSGKTTLVRLLAGLVAPDEGEISIFGCDMLRRPAQARRQVNGISIGASFYKQLSAVENLLNAARLYGIQRAEAQERVTGLLRRLGLDEDEIHRPLETTSFSVQQRVSIACALLARPRLLLLDEPASGLDGPARRAVQRVIREQRDEAGMTVLFTTQELTLAGELSDRLGVLDAGRLTSPDGTAASRHAGEAELALAGMPQEPDL